SIRFRVAGLSGLGCLPPPLVAIGSIAGGVDRSDRSATRYAGPPWRAPNRSDRWSTRGYCAFIVRAPPGGLLSLTLGRSRTSFAAPRLLTTVCFEVAVTEFEHPTKAGNEGTKVRLLAGTP